jgi:uncharacterized ferredoxin-like protein
VVVVEGEAVEKVVEAVEELVEAVEFELVEEDLQ